MPEIKQSFVQGKMNKDLDERIVPKGEYRDALNIEVSTSDSNNVGTIQSMAGNQQMSSIPGLHNQHLTSGRGAMCMGAITDSKNDKIYWLINSDSPPARPVTEEERTVWHDKDIIAEYDVQNNTTAPVLVDIHQVWVSLNTNNVSTSPASNDLSVIGGTQGILPGMIVEGLNATNEVIYSSVVTWKGSHNIIFEDNISAFTSGGINYNFFDLHNLRFKNDFGRVLKFNKNNIITGINILDDMLLWTDNESEPKKINITRSKFGSFDFNTHTKLAITNQYNFELFVNVDNESHSLIQEDHITVIRKYPMAAPVLEMKNTTRSGNIIVSIRNPLDTTVTTTEISPIGINPQVGDKFEKVNLNAFVVEDLSHDFQVGDIVKLSTLVNNILVEGRLRILGINQDDISVQYPGQGPQDVSYIDCVLLSISDNTTISDINWQMELEQEDAMFEFKFPRFAYRYKYEDGEYSAISPFSEVAFLPEGGAFDYLPKKGYNLSMVNNVRHLAIKDFVLGDNLQGASVSMESKTPLPTDVASIDILYKESNSSNIYTVKTIKRKHDEFNAINSAGDPAISSRTRGYLNITSEMIHHVLPSNQLLRPWDNVPRKALAQEISGNRLIYANYLQGYNVDINDSVLRADVSSRSISKKEYPEQMDTTDVYNYYPAKSLKSLRTYQLGVVYRDKYGRETPILTGNKVDSSVSLDKYYADKQSQFKVNLVGDLPEWVDSYKFFIKETSNEYYNIAMDRWYDAEDGNIWISFPSSERNKIDEDSYLTLKKKHDEDAVVAEAPAKYKVISIKAEAPEFIKLKSKITGLVYEVANPTNDPAILSVLGAGNVNNFPLEQRRVFALLDSGQGVSGISEKYIGESVNNLHVRFKNKNVFTRWYEVTAVELIGGAGSTTNDVEITIKESLTADVNILTSGGQSSQDKYDNRYKSADIKVQFAEKHVQNRPEFDGRFFVKIHRDSILLKNILTEPNTDFGEDTSYHITHVHKVHYIDATTPWAIGQYSTVVTSTGSLTGTYQSPATGDDWHGFGVPPGEINHYSRNLEYREDNNNPPYFDPNWTNVLTGKNFWGSFENKNWVANNNVKNAMFIDGNSAFQYLSRESWGDVSDELTFAFGFVKLGRAHNYKWYSGSSTRWSSIAPVADAVPSGVVLNPQPGKSCWIHPFGSPQNLTYFPDVQPDALFDINTFGTTGWASVMNSIAGVTVGTPLRAAPDPLGNMTAIGFIDTPWTTNKESLGLADKFCHLSWSGIKSVDDASGNNLKISQNTGKYQDQLDFFEVLVEQGALWKWEEDPDQRIYQTTTTHGAKYQPLFNTAFWHSYHSWGTDAEFPEGLFTLDANKFWNKRNRVSIHFKDILTGGGVGEGPSQYKPTNDPTYPAHFNSDGVRLDTAGGSLPVDIITGAVLPAPGIRSDGMGSGVDHPTSGNEIPSGGLKQISTTNTSNDYIPGSVTWQVMKPISEQEDIKYASHNPAIFETEPKEDVGLDIYHEIGQVYPVELNERTSEMYIPIGSKVKIWRPKWPWISFPAVSTGNINIGDIKVKEFDYSKSSIKDTLKIVLEYAGGGLVNTLSPGFGSSLAPGDHLTFTRPDGSSTSAVLYWETWTNVAPAFFQTTFTDLVAIGTYMLDTDVHSRSQKPPWFNCYSFGNGVESDRIRDDYNAITIDNGPKVSSIIEGAYEEERKSSTLIYSDLYNSNTGINNLNQFIQAEKITKDINPTYGSIQKLHARDTNLVTLCEDKCLRILVDKNALFNADGSPQLLATRGVLGQTIPFSGEFGISKNPESFTAEGFRAYFTDRNRGAVLRLSKDGLTVISEYGMKDWFADNLPDPLPNITNKLIGSYNSKKSLYNITLAASLSGIGIIVASDSNKTVSFSEKVKGWPSFKSFIPEQGVSINNDYYTFKAGDIWKHHIMNNYGYPNKRNNFYDNQYDSSVEFLLNGSPEIVKNFNTLNYEGSESRIIFDWEDPNYYNNVNRDGWYVEKIETDLQSGNALEFKGKEGKWFAQIKGETTTLQNLDTEEFSVQGIGNCNAATVLTAPPCISPSLTINYIVDTTINTNDGTMTLGSINYDISVTPPATCVGFTAQIFTIDIDNIPTPLGWSIDWPVSNVFPSNTMSSILLPGNYSFVVTDCDGCSTTELFSIVHDGTTVGCMDSNAFNYDPNAVYEPTPSPCVNCIHGCMNSWALTGYDPLATCNCPELVPGSNDGIGQIPNTTTSCTSCTYSSFGCTDSVANNYNPIATVDDGSCTYDDTYTCIRGNCHISPIGTGYWTDANYYSVANGYTGVAHTNPGQTCMAYCVCDNIDTSTSGGTGWTIDMLTADTGSCAAPNNDGAINGNIDLTNYTNAIEGYSRWKVQLFSSAEYNILLAETPYGGTGATPPVNGWGTGHTVPLTGSFNFTNLSPCNTYSLKLVVENTLDVTQGNNELYCWSSLPNSTIPISIGTPTLCGPCDANDGPQPQTANLIGPVILQDPGFNETNITPTGQFGGSAEWVSDPSPSTTIQNALGLGVAGSWVIDEPLVARAVSGQGGIIGVGVATHLGQTQGGTYAAGNLEQTLPYNMVAGENYTCTITHTFTSGGNIRIVGVGDPNVTSGNVLFPSSPFTRTVTFTVHANAINKDKLVIRTSADGNIDDVTLIRNS